MVGFLIGYLCGLLVGGIAFYRFVRDTDMAKDECETFVLTEEQREALHDKYSK